MPPGPGFLLHCLDPDLYDSALDCVRILIPSSWSLYVRGGESWDSCHLWPTCLSINDLRCQTLVNCASRLEL